MRIHPADLIRVTKSVLTEAGVSQAQAQSVTENLVWCDMAGRRNHGVERLPILLKQVEAGGIKAAPSPAFHRVSPCAERLDADRAFGHHASRLATDRACALASEQGIGVVGVTNSNFFGAGAYYADLAAQQDMVSLVLSNSFPKVAAPGGIRAALGTNPFAFGAPRRDGHSILVDMSTAAVAGSTVREKAAKGEQFEPGVAVDSDGAPILDPAKVMSGTLLPAAGGKGFGLAVMVEILAAVLTGAGITRELGSMYKDIGKGGNNGHFFMALDVSRWMAMDDFHARMDLLAASVADSAPDGGSRLPGEARWSAYADSQANGIALEVTTRQSLEALAAESDVAVPWLAERR